MLFPHLFYLFLVLYKTTLAYSLELILSQNENYNINLDETYQLNEAHYKMIPAKYSQVFTYNITPRLIKSIYNMNRNFLKIIENPLSLGYFLALDPQNLVLLYFNGTNLINEELATIYIGNITGSEDLLYCQSVLYLENNNIIVDCIVSNQNKVAFIILKIIKNEEKWNFTLKSIYSPENIQLNILSCSNRVFQSFQSFIFYFCPYSTIKEMSNSSIPIENQLFLFNFDPVALNFTQNVISNVKAQDIVKAYDSFIVLIDFEKGLLFYKLENNLIVPYKKIPLPETTYLYIGSRTIDSVFPEKIQNFLYVASRHSLLEILYNTSLSIVYSKFYELNTLNESNFFTNSLILTKNFVIAIQKNSLDGLKEKDMYIIKIFSNNLKRVSNIHHIEYFQTNFLRGFTFESYRYLKDNIVLSLQGPNGENNIAILKIDDSKLNVSCCLIEIKKELSTYLELKVLSDYNNHTLNFTSVIYIYLIPFNYTGIMYRQNPVKNYTFRDNYYEFQLKSITLGSNEEYLFLGNGFYDGSSSQSKMGNIFVDYVTTLVIRDHLLKGDQIIDCFLDFQTHILMIYIYNNISYEFYRLICTEFNYKFQFIQSCVKDQTMFNIESLSYVYIKEDIIFIYSKKTDMIYLCLPLQSLCGSNKSYFTTNYDEILFINKNLIIARKNVTNGTSLDLFSIEVEENLDNDNPIEPLRIFMHKKNYNDSTHVKSNNVLYLDATLVNLNLLVMKTYNEITIFQIISNNYTNFNLVKTFEYPIESCYILLLTIGRLVSVCADYNTITEYIIESPYCIVENRNYPLFWYKINFNAIPSTDQKYIYITGTDTRNNDNVILIYNPSAPTCEILAKISSFSTSIKKFIPVKSQLTSYSLFYLFLNDVTWDYLHIININPILYGNFSLEIFMKFYFKNISNVQFDLMFANGPKKLVTSFFSNISMIGSELTRSDQFLNKTTIFMDSKYQKDNITYSIPIDDLFSGPIEDLNFIPQDPINFPFVFQDLIIEDQYLSDYHTSAYLYKRTIDMLIFGDLLIVLTENFLFFLIDSQYLHILYKETTSFIDATCRISHHNIDQVFIVYCQNDTTAINLLYLYKYQTNILLTNYYLKNKISLGLCFSCLVVKHFNIVLPGEFGIIKKIILLNGYFFSLSFLINNINQETFTICDFESMLEKENFLQIGSFKAANFGLTYFRTKDIDIMTYNQTIDGVNTTQFLTVIILNHLFQNGISVVIIDFNFINHTIITFTSSKSNPFKGLDSTQVFMTIKLLQVSDENNFSCIIGTNRRFYEGLLRFKESFYLNYTYEHYNNCENLPEKPVIYENFLVGICNREDKGERNPEVLPIFREYFNETTLLFYKRRKNKNFSYPIKMLRSYNVDPNYKKKFLIFKDQSDEKKTKLLVSDPFNFLVVYYIYTNVTFYLKNKDSMIRDLFSNFRGRLVVSNKFDRSYITIIFARDIDSNVNKIIIYAIFGFFLGIGFLLMLAFLFFGIRKIEEKGKGLVMKTQGKVLSNLIHDSSLISASIKNRVLVKKNGEKKRKNYSRYFKKKEKD